MVNDGSANRSGSRNQNIADFWKLIKPLILVEKFSRNEGIWSTSEGADFIERYISLLCSLFFENAFAHGDRTKLPQLTLFPRWSCSILITAWEQRKLGELCTFSKGHGYSKADIRDAGTPLILYGRLYTQFESRIEEVDTFAVEQDGSILSRGNEVIVPASGETAEDIAVASSVRRSGIILGGDLNVVTPTSKLDPDYAALAITYSKAHDDLAKRAQGKSVVHVHGNDIAEVEVSYPSESEQKRISSVVLHLDNLITLHQREPGFTDMGYMRVERALMTMSMSLFSSS